MADDEGKDVAINAGVALSAAAAALAAPWTAVLTAPAAVMVSALLARGQRRAINNANLLTDWIMERTGLNAEEINDWAETAEAAGMLVDSAIRASASAEDEHKIRIYANLVRGGVRDTAAVDHFPLLVDTIAQLNPEHLMFLLWLDHLSFGKPGGTAP
jgi:hypothetical protein